MNTVSLDSIDTSYYPIFNIHFLAKPPTPTKKKGKSKNVEAESVHVISSDEEGDDKPAKVVHYLIEILFLIITSLFSEHKYFK